MKEGIFVEANGTGHSSSKGSSSFYTEDCKKESESWIVTTYNEARTLGLRLLGMQSGIPVQRSQHNPREKLLVTTQNKNAQASTSNSSKSIVKSSADSDIQDSNSSMIPSSLAPVVETKAIQAGSAFSKNFSVRTLTPKRSEYATCLQLSLDVHEALSNVMSLNNYKSGYKYGYSEIEWDVKENAATVLQEAETFLKEFKFETVRNYLAQSELQNIQVDIQEAFRSANEVLHFLYARANLIEWALASKKGVHGQQAVIARALSNFELLIALLSNVVCETAEITRPTEITQATIEARSEKILFNRKAVGC